MSARLPKTRKTRPRQSPRAQYFAKFPAKRIHSPSFSPPAPGLLPDREPGLIAAIIACTWSTSSELIVSLKSIVTWSGSGERPCGPADRTSDSRIYSDARSGPGTCGLNTPATLAFSDPLGLACGEIVNESFASSIANRFSSFSCWVSTDGDVTEAWAPASPHVSSMLVLEPSKTSVFPSEHTPGAGDTLAEHRDVLALSASTIW